MTTLSVGKLCILYTIVNSEIYTQVLENFLIFSIKNWFANYNDFYFQQENTSSHQQKGTKLFKIK